MIHYLYQITNLVNNKIYVGVHSTHNINDGYMGSGIRIENAIKKYGKQNFRKDILEFFETAELAYTQEQQLVNEDFVLRTDTYNQKVGGKGWIPGAVHSAISKAACEKFKHLNSTDANFRASRSSKISLSLKQYYQKDNTVPTASTRRWVSNDELKSTKYVHLLEMDHYCSLGWVPGRKYHYQK